LLHLSLQFNPPTSHYWETLEKTRKKDEPKQFLETKSETRRYGDTLPPGVQEFREKVLHALMADNIARHRFFNGNYTGFWRSMGIVTQTHLDDMIPLMLSREVDLVKGKSQMPTKCL